MRPIDADALIEKWSAEVKTEHNFYTVCTYYRAMNDVRRQPTIGQETHIIAWMPLPEPIKEVENV